MANRFALAAIFNGIDRMTPAVKRMQKEVQSLNRTASDGLGRVDAMNARVASGIKSTALALSGVALMAGTAAGNVIGAGADFEQAITNVGAVSLVTRDQIADLEQKALDLGATTKFSATEVANAMEMMGKAGFTNAEILSGVGGILAAAAAEGAGIEETASHVSNVLKGMGLATSEAARVADVLTLASSRTNSSIGSLGESMKNVSSTARQLGVPLEDTVAMVALLQDVGLDASEAGSAVATMLTMMANPSKEAQKQMKALGVSFEDAKGNMLAPTAVLEQLAKGAAGAGGNMKQVAFFAELVGMRGQKAAVNLQELFKKGNYKGLTDELNAAAGSAEKMASIRMDTLKGDWEQLGGAVDGVKIALFDMQAGPLRGVVQDMTKWVEANRAVILADVGAVVKEWTPILIGFAAGVKSGWASVEPIITGVGSALGGVFGSDVHTAQTQAELLGRDITRLGVAFVGFTVVTKGAAAATFLFGNVTRATRGAVIAYEVTVRAVRGAMLLYQMATKAGVASTIAMSVASKAVQIDMIATRGAALIASSGFVTMAKTAGAAALAIGAVMLAADQAQKFADENGGAEGVKGFFGIGTDDWGFEGVDQVMNRQAKARRKEEDEQAARDKAEQEANAGKPLEGVGDPMTDLSPAALAGMERMLEQYGQGPGLPPGAGMPPAGMPGVPPAGGLPAPATAPPPVSPEQLKAAVHQSLEVTLRVPEGADAEVTKKPPGAKVNLKPSGDD